MIQNGLFLFCWLSVELGCVKLIIKKSNGNKVTIILY